MRRVFNNIILLIILFFGNIFINEHKYFFLLIYICLLLYHLYISLILIKQNEIQYFDIKNFLFISVLLYLFTYFIICDPNPFFCFISFYIFYPDFLKAIMIIVIHTNFLSYYINNKRHSIKLKLAEESPFKFKQNNANNKESYFLSIFLEYFLNGKNINDFKSDYQYILIFRKSLHEQN